MNQDEFTVDEAESRRSLERLKAEAFGGSDEEMAVAMGKTVEDIRYWLSGGGIDEDAQMKINGIAKERLSE